MIDAKTSNEIRDSRWFQETEGRGLNAEQPLYGINAWRRNGFRCLRVHFGADPDKSPDTEQGRKFIAASKVGTPTYAWLQERGIDHTVTPGDPVYCDFDRIVCKPQSYRPWLILFRTWDFGWRMPAVVYFQVEPPTAETNNRYRVHILREVISSKVLISQFADQHVLPAVEQWFPGALRVDDFGDPAGNQHDDKSPETSIEILQTRGVRVRSRAMTVDEGIEIVQAIISAGDFEVDPLACKTILEGFRSGYVRDDKGFPLKDMFYEHVMDALRYGIANVFRLKIQSINGQRVKQAELARLVTTTGDGPRLKPAPQSGLPRL